MHVKSQQEARNTKMDDQRLDSIARSFAVSRRAGARTLLGALLTMQAVSSAQPADAR